MHATRHRGISSITNTTVVETLDPFPQQVLNTMTSSVSLPLNTMSNGRDRTYEFQTTLKTFASRRNGLHHPHQVPKRPHSAMEQRSIFMQNAKQIGANLSQTFLKLEQLTMLAKESSLFIDRSVEIQSLTLSIKEDMNDLNKQIGLLRQYMHKSGGSKSKNSKTHSNSVVFVLQSKLATMSNNFKQVLDARTESLKEQKIRRENISRNNVASSIAATPPVTNGRRSALHGDDTQSTTNGDTVIDLSSQETYHSRAQQQLQMIDETEAYLESRSETMQNIEHTIIELGGIFTQLATMIQEQGELVLRIDANVDEATHHIEAAHTELLKYIRSITSNRWLMIKVFAVLIIFFIIFIVFLA